MRTRDTNLDLLRAVAIVMVVALHLTIRWPGTASPSALRLAAFGGYGVDLFFVLSGWLIGGLYWRERERFGDVQLGRFVCRRALRTVPPYLAALGLSFASVALVRRERFDPGFLFFVQNYYRDIPYFHVSWSLCVEEHFYLLMPLLALGLLRVSRRPEWFLLGLTLLPMGFRAMNWDGRYPGDAATFGYALTATHLRYEGLLLGVWAAFLQSHRPEQWRILRRVAPLTGAVALFVVVAATWQSGWARYVFSFGAFAVFATSLLVSLVGRAPVLWSDSRAVFWMATTSYSVYLTHWVALASVVRFWDRIPGGMLVRCGLTVLAVAAAGAVFYWTVEVPSLGARHRLMPGRTRERSPLLDAALEGPSVG